MKLLKQCSNVTVKDAAIRLGVSVATIRNWIKTGYLKQSIEGTVTVSSLKKFQIEIAGKVKLTKRANKSLVDSHDHDKLSVDILRRISQLNSLDTIGLDYEDSLSKSYRNKEGVYYTPKIVVDNLFLSPKNSIDDASFCDPCCGSGNFIIRAVELGFNPENIYGYDIDPVAVKITKARIYKATGYKSRNIKVLDFLELATYQKVQRFDHIYTNPPWGKKSNKDIKDVIALKLKAGSSVDTCSLFFFACLKCLKPDGSLGLLLPESFFNVATFETARIKALQFSIYRLIDYGKVFKGLVTKAQAIVLKNKAHTTISKAICEVKGLKYKRTVRSFLCNPKSIINLHCNDMCSSTLKYLMAKPHITLKDAATWGIGIVTGSNKKFIRNSPSNSYVCVYRGSDILKGELKESNTYIPRDMSLYQQVAPLHVYEAKEKLIYKFISSKLCFFYDVNQQYVLNSANILIPNKNFPISMKVLCDLLNSDFMNWLFLSIFNTNKVLRGDLEVLPIYSQFLKNVSTFNETNYLERLNLEKKANNSYKIKSYAY